MANTTLVPIDFSENSFLALDHAAELGTVMKGETISLLHIIEDRSFKPISEDTYKEEFTNDSLTVEGALVRLKKVAEKYTASHPDTQFKCLVSGGKPYKEIAETAEEIKAHLIVMGSHGSSGIQAFAGSNASKVIQLAPCPVVVIREKRATNGYKNIVLPLDLTAETTQKADFAIRIARYYHSTIHLLFESVTDEFMMSRLNNNINEVKARFKKARIAYTLEGVPSGNFGRNTINWAQDHHADLIIIMAEMETGIATYLFGTTAQQIVNRSPVPVMAITPREELEGIFDGSSGL